MLPYFLDIKKTWHQPSSSSLLSLHTSLSSHPSHLFQADKSKHHANKFLLKLGELQQ